MEPANTLYSSILLLGAAHGLFLALALINIKGGNAIAHRLLALLTLTFAVDLGMDFLRESYYLVKLPKLIFIEGVSSFLYGPLAYFYVCALTTKDGYHFSRRNWYHFLPFVIGVLLLLPFFGLSNDHILELVYLDADVDDSIGLWVIGGIVVMLLPMPLIGIYLALSFRRLIRHSRSIRLEFSSIERISLAWLRNLLIALVLLFIIYLVGTVFSGALGAAKDAEAFLNLAVVIVIYTIGYMGIRQPVIFSQKSSKPERRAERPEVAIDTSADTERKKYQKSALDSDMSRALHDELQRIMGSERPYLDSTLTLTQLAAQMRISPNYLSQVINEQTGNNFFDFVNKHRVAAAKQLLEDPQQAKASILTIAMDAGFNSKSAFYTAFKRHTNETPTQFRKSLAAISEPKNGGK